MGKIKQGIRCLFPKFSELEEEEVKKILELEEYKLFSQMMKYDKWHSFEVYKRVKNNETLKEDKNYLKLSLLHDVGKGKVSFFRRVKKVILGDKKLEKHPEIGYEKLKDINKEVALLCREHHNNTESLKLKIFQKLDDE